MASGERSDPDRGVDDAALARWTGALDRLLDELRDAPPAQRAAARAELEARLEAWPRVDVPDAEGEPATDPDADWHGIVGASDPILAVRDLIVRFAKTSAPVLIHGESGTGKELVARSLHDLSPRAEGPFVAENCSAIPETLLESVLFGHAKGAFTGAVRDHAGHFAAADRGTLFLDEVGDMPASMQAKLLRVLQDGEVRPVGGTRSRKVDVRVVAASHRDLDRCVREGTFREDLLYRLAVLRIDLPPLRARGDDVLLLARRFLAAAAERAGRELRFGPEAEAALVAFDWPGNVRQLQNEVQRVATLADGPVIARADLSPDVAAARRDRG